MLGSENGHVGVVELLVQRGADVIKADKDGWTPLMLGSENGLVGVVELLVQHGADVNKADKNGWTPLMLGSENGHVNVVEALIEHGASICGTTTDGFTALMLACRNGHVCVAKALLKHNKAIINYTTTTGYTALTFACVTGQLGVVETLISCGADLDRSSTEDLTALMIAISLAEIHALLDRMQEITTQGNRPEHRAPFVLNVNLNQRFEVEKTKYFAHGNITITDRGDDPDTDQSGHDTDSD
ncbi:ankyrin repeat protein [Elysia marginata]|uniref:Ankyrin repeat protein n=1 Tax=Elysia marginata TaxID=1093978 RepID=A0AAV4FF63_9GAST|nr:ankyrin repeat protein [Elysia marginata]